MIDKKQSSQLNSVNLKQIDTSVVNWFKEKFPLVINSKKVDVVYATSERWARATKDKGFRDEKGTIILPLISIRRTTPDHMKERYAPESDETNITLIKRISTSPISENDRQSGEIGNRVQDELYVKTSDVPIYEILQYPFPSFSNLDYEIIIWTSYMTHQNIEQENILQEFRGGRQWFEIDNYKFFGEMKSITDESNLADFSDKEKIIKYNFKLVLQGYFVNKKELKLYRTSGNMKINIHETIVDKFPA